MTWALPFSVKFLDSFNLWSVTVHNWTMAEQFLERLLLPRLEPRNDSRCLATHPGDSPQWLHLHRCVLPR